MSRHYKHRRTGSLKKEIEHIVDSELKKNVELKHFNVYAVTDGGTGWVAPDGECLDLSQIPQGDQQSQRDGDIVQFKTLRIRIQIQGQAPTSPVATFRDGCALVRYIIFTWIPSANNATFSPNAWASILDTLSTASSYPGSVILAPHASQGEALQFRIHVDETVSLSPSAGRIRPYPPYPYASVDYQVSDLF